MENKKTEQFFFNESIRILFWMGQFPIVILSLLFLFVVATLYSGQVTWRFSVTSCSGFIAIILSFLAVLSSKKEGQAIPVIFLVLSLFLTLFYLSWLVRMTSATPSPFQHLYLYLPAIVFMVARRRHWAEWLAVCGIFCTFYYSYENPLGWPAWEKFISSPGFRIFEVLFFLLLLFLMKQVSYKLDEVQEREREMIQSQIPVQTE